MICARKVFPEKVIAYVTNELANVTGNEPVPTSMLPSETMKRSRLKDTTVSQDAISQHLYAGTIPTNFLETDGRNYCEWIAVNCGD
jgi:hypothetical protein